ncbi:MAG: electron transport complex subunit RsxC [Xanthomonadales bacterium]|nr:electron transport complex subunit RsxC [Xanthomonadales bacterium]
MFGGLRLAPHKEAADAPMRRIEAVESLQVSMLQHSGRPARPVVQVGDRVRRGDLLGAAADVRSAPVHAPIDAVVEAIVEQPSWLPSADAILHVHLRRTDSAGAPRCLAPLGECTDAEALRERVREAGIVGLGGAGFPTADKLGGDRSVLILNGVECEPHIACDDRLLREDARAVLGGGRWLARICGAQQVLIAVEDSMHAAIDALRAVLADFPGITLRVVPDRYPQGGERQLIATLCGVEVPADGLPRDVGILVANVATAAATHAAIERGEPLTRRWVSVSGDAVAAPGVFEVPIGLPVAELVAAAGGYTADAVHLLLGGSMMGTALPDDAAPIGKLHNAVTVLRARAGSTAPALPCIRCGACADACPVRLLPQQLHAFSRAEDDGRLQAQGLFACIECGCCDPVCPSGIPLTAQFRQAKQRIQLEAVQRVQADTARQRHELRQQRLLETEALRAERREARRQQVTDPIQAALARARAKAAGEREPPA